MREETPALEVVGALGGGGECLVERAGREIWHRPFLPGLNLLVRSLLIAG